MPPTLFLNHVSTQRDEEDERGKQNILVIVSEGFYDKLPYVTTNFTMFFHAAFLLPFGITLLLKGSLRQSFAKILSNSSQ